MIAKLALLLFLGNLLRLEAAGCKVTRIVPIQLINDAAAPPKMVAAAQGGASTILRSLCAEIEWVGKPSAEKLEIRIIAKAPKHGPFSSAFGATILNVEGGHRATIFFSRVQEGPRQYFSTIKLEVLLGCVIAHEIGHMLLNPIAHDQQGVMVGNFGEDEVLKASQGRLTFTQSNLEKFFRSPIARRLATKESLLSALNCN